MKRINENIKSILAVAIVALSFTYFFIVTFLSVDSPQILIAIVGSLSGVLGYYFGASSGSSKKDDTISSMAKSASTNKDEVGDIGGGGIKNPKP